MRPSCCDFGAYKPGLCLSELTSLIVCLPVSVFGNFSSCLLYRRPLRFFDPDLVIIRRMHIEGNPGSSSPKGHALVGDSSPDEDTQVDPFVQNIFVLRHGEVESAVSERPWDPPLSDHGKLQAWQVGRNFRLEEWNITRVVMSPFIRCVQTAAEVIAGLCLQPSSAQVRDQGSAISSLPLCPIKASVECGLTELMNRQGMWCLPQGVEKKTHVPWTLDLAELYSLLPKEFHFQPIRQMLPSYYESGADMQCQFTSTLQKIANKFHTENILCITHDEGVMQSASMMWPRVKIYGVTCCAYTHAQRPNFKWDNGISILRGEWELLTESGSTSGIFFNPCT